ncbi:hypothetical protein GCM10011397_13910 [Wenyingzhuangia marina]|nr:hypothetical protein GCM10011397_13910 [Wenyingzhuangia marina]
MQMNAKDINSLMTNFDNKYALEHTELYSKQTIEENYFLPVPIFHRNIKIINVSSSWLESITTLLKLNPEAIYPYFNTTDKNLAAYIILAHVFDYQMPDISSHKESLYINNLKRDVFDESIVNKYKLRHNLPNNIDDVSSYMLNIIWSDVSDEANNRIKNAVNLKMRH